MSEDFIITVDGTCQSCKSNSHTGECVQCFTCECYFHAICESTNNDNKLASKTMITTFLAVSTKNNFKFYCDGCLTNLEISNAESTSEKVATLEKKYTNIEKKIEEIKDLLLKKDEKPTKNKEVKNNQPSIWNNKEKLETVKAPPLESVLIVKKNQDVNQHNKDHATIENTILDNKIPVIKSYQMKTGDLKVVCESKDIRDKLKNLVTATNQNIELTTPVEKRSKITIVGLKKEYKKEEILEMLPIQNDFIKMFSVSNNIQEHFSIYAVRPCKNNKEIYQVIATASPVFRQGLQHHNDRLTLGLATCRIYDQYHIKRCNICQNFGHYAKECPTPDSPICSQCSEEHLTEQCKSFDEMCINCLRTKEDDTGHSTTSFKCPSYIKQQNQLKNKLTGNHLNMRINNLLPNR